MRWEYQNHQNIIMDQALSVARSVRATDSRDKTFALLGLCEDLRLLLGPADYTKHTNDLWLTACRAWLQSDPTLASMRAATKPPPVPDLIIAVKTSLPGSLLLTSRTPSGIMSHGHNDLSMAIH